MWTVVAIVVGTLVVVAIALVAVGGVTARLSREAPTSVFDLDEAVEQVADDLPGDVQARLSYDDVRSLIGWHLDYLERQGVAGEVGIEVPASGPLVAADDEGLAWVLGQVDAASLDVDDADVAEVLEAELAYLLAIGAIGTAVPGPPDPDDGRAGPGVAAS